MDHAQFSNANENETRFLAVEKSLHKTEHKSHSKMQETLDFKITIAMKTSILTNL